MTEKYSGTEICGFKLPHRLHFSSRHNSFLHIFVIINSYFGSYTVSLLLEDKLVRKAGARLDTLGEEVETRATLSPTLKQLYGTKNIKLESNILFIAKQSNTESHSHQAFQLSHRYKTSHVRYMNFPLGSIKFSFLCDTHRSFRSCISTYNSKTFF